MKEHITLQYGLPYQGRTVTRLTLRPLTVGAELSAAAETDDLPPLPENAADADILRRSVLETLIYWSHQLEAEGIPRQELTGAFLMDSLAGADYRLIMAAQEALAGKSAAASAEYETAAEEAAAAPTTEPPTATTAKP